MVAVVQTLRKWYQAEIWVLDHVKHLFLLILRLYFGWGFKSAGLGKLLNVETHTGFFRDWGIPLPMLNVYLAGTAETICGFLLLIGAASRIITIPLLGTMFVAYLTAHTEQLYAL
jgi:putative oxidoreductase